MKLEAIDQEYCATGKLVEQYSKPAPPTWALLSTLKLAPHTFS